MYLIDSDVLIDAKNRHYGFDFVPAFWDWIAQQHQAGRVFTVQKVADEVLAGADEFGERDERDEGYAATEQAQYVRGSLPFRLSDATSVSSTTGSGSCDVGAPCSIGELQELV